MTTAIAFDDEKNALGIIREYSNNIDNLLIADTFTDPMKGLEFIRKNPEVDLVFMDIHMGSANGLSIASQLPPHIKVVLTTAYPEHAVEGYELNIIDYLLKPFTLERFVRSFEKFRTQAIRRNDSVWTSSAPSSSNNNVVNGFIFVKTEYKVIKIRLEELKIVEGAGNYVALHVEKSKILTLQNMKSFEEYLYAHKFIRVHKSFIVSLKYIDAIENNVIHIGDKVIPIGDSYRENLQKFINCFAKMF